MKFLSPQARIILVTLLTVVVALLGNWVTNMYEVKLEKLFGQYYTIVLPSLFLLITFFLVLVTLWHSKASKNEVSVQVNFTDAVRNVIITHLLELYTVKHQNKLDDRLALNLEFKYSQVGTEQAYVDKYFLKEAKTDEDVQSGLLELSEKYRYLLILGEPGAGKSTLLLDLALSLLKEKKMDDPDQPFPFIFNLAYWEQRYSGNIIGWMQNRIVEEKICDSETAVELINKRKIIPLFDGLDEIKIDKKDISLLYRKCLEDIEMFLAKYDPPKMVITSRIEEYKNVNSYAPIRAQILVKSLRPEQLNSSLEEALNNTAFLSKRPYANPVAVQNIIGLLKDYPQLTEVLCTPFYFNLACQVFSISDISNTISVPSEPDDFKEFLVSHFVDNALDMQHVEKKGPSPKKSRRWLRSLARLLRSNTELHGSNGSDKGVFSADDLLKLPSSRSHSYLELIDYIVKGLILGLYFWFFFDDLKYILHGLFLFAIRYIYILSPQAVLNLLYTYRWPGYRLMFIGKIKLAVIINFVYFIIYSLTLIVFSKLEDIPYLSLGLIIFFVDFLMGCLNFILWATIFNRDIAGYNGYTVSVKGSSAQFLFKYSLLVIREIMVFTFLGIPIIALLTQPSNLVFITSIIALKIFIVSPVYEKIVGRSIKVITGELSIRHVKFLNFATERRILERDGANWRFRHKILQDYFYNPKPKNPLTGRLRN